MPDPLSPADRDVLAGELVLGLLDPAERAEAMRLRASDPAFARDVDKWSMRLDPLYASFPDGEAPDLWPAIQRQLGALNGRTVQRALSRWRAGAIVSTALAATLAGVLLLRPAPAPVEIVRAPDQVAVAQLGAEDAPALLAVNYDPAAGEMRIRALHLPASKLVPELWLIPADGVPRSLGLLGSGPSSKVALSAQNRALLHDGVTLAITLEPHEGAPHRAPSSAPIAAGKISTI